MSNIRAWATPLTIGAFLLSGVTGILMFFHLDSGLNKAAHEWLSWALVAGVGLHLAANFRAFKGYLKRPRAMAVVAAFAVLLGVSFLPLAGEGRGSPVAAVIWVCNAISEPWSQVSDRHITAGICGMAAVIAAATVSAV